MLVHIKELFKKDIAEKFAYPAFNTQNLETTIGIVQAAEELRVPFIAAPSEGTISYAGLETIFEIVVTVAEKTKAPVALHLDHGNQRNSEIKTQGVQDQKLAQLMALA